MALLMCSFLGLSAVSALADADVTVKTDFTALTSLDDADGVVESVGVSVNGDATHGAIPSDTWGSPFLIADKSYIVYELDATKTGEGKIFDTVSVSIDGRVWNQNSGTAHAENAVNVYAGVKKNNVSTLIHSYNPGNSNNSTNFAALGEPLDLSEFFAAGYNKAYIKVELVQSKTTDGETVAGDDGTIDIWFAGVKLKSVEISATTKVGELAVIPDFEMESDFTKQPLSSANVMTAVGVCSDSNEHGLLAGSAWGASVSVPEQSYVIYKLKADDRKVFDKLLLGISGKLWGQDDENAYAYNSFVISFSDDNENYDNEIVLNCAAVGNGEFAYENFDASDRIPAGSDTIYIKIEFKQYVASAGDQIELAFVGTKLYKVSVAGVFADKEYVNVNYYDGETIVNTVEYEKGSDLAAYVPAEKEGYDFDGWYLDAETTQKLPENYVVEADVSIYGKWTEKQSPDNPDTPDNPDNPDNPDKPENPDKPTETKKGCGSAIGTASVAVMFTAIAAAFIAIRRKEKRD